MSDIEQRLRERATSYRSGGPSSEHTASLLDEAADSLEDATGALDKCQRVLAMLTDPDSRAETNITSAWAQCVEAELVARRTLASLREADHG